MKIAIVYTSQTGNTKLLADTIKETMLQKKNTECCYFGAPNEQAAAEAKKADLVLAGFWTDKENCSDEMSAFLKNLSGKKVFLFGTAGFGGSSHYFELIFSKVKEHLNTSNILVGTYMCQGKMPMGVRKIYEKRADQEPEKIAVFLKNFDQAMTHPDEADLQKLRQTVMEL
ncbi:MAG: flavodoxin family protein [Lachnospiraceae bacterium]|nr:flavodoxin family protein [Lachnospiraceae bacterium]